MRSNGAQACVLCEKPLAIELRPSRAELVALAGRAGRVAAGRELQHPLLSALSSRHAKWYAAASSG